MKELGFPLADKNTLLDLRAGDEVMVSGIIIRRGMRPIKESAR